MTTPAATVSVAFTAHDDGVAQAVRALVTGIREVGRAERQTSQETRRLSLDLGDLARKAGGVYLLVRAFDALRRGVSSMTREGFQIRAAVETAELGIASLITAQADVVDASGKQLQGVEALNAAYAVSGDQVDRLRVQGLQTIATTEQLVEAFQQAVGPGMAAGLDLDQVRVATVQIVQAAGALGVPMDQLNQEVRSILDGTIDRNSRVAKAINLSNAQVKQAKEQNRLADMLNEKFGAFSVAGERVAKSFAGVTSNIKEAAQVASGEVVKPLYDEIARSGQAGLERVFDLETGQIRSSFQPIVTAIQDVFQVVADSLRAALSAAGEKAEDLAVWLKANRDEVIGVVEGVFELMGAIASVAGAVGGVLLDVTRWGVETGVIEVALRVVADVLEIVASIVGSINSGVVVVLGTLWAVNQAMIAIKGVFLATLVAGAANPMGAALVALAGVIMGVVVVLRLLRGEQKDAGEEAARLAEAQADQVESSQSLAGQMDAQKKALAGMAEGSEEAGKAAERLAGLEERLIEINPLYEDALAKARNGQLSYAEAIRQANSAMVEQIAWQNMVAWEQKSAAEKRRDAARARLEEVSNPRRENGQPPPMGEAVYLARQQLAKAETEFTAARDAFERSDAALSTAIAAVEVRATIRPRPRAGDTDGDKGALARARAEMEARLAALRAAMEAAQRALDKAMGENAISYRAYYDELTRIQQSFIDAQIAGQRHLLTVATKPEDRLKIQAEITELEARRTTVAEENTARRIADERRLAEQIAGIRIRMLEAEGKTFEARSAQLIEEFRELRARLKAEDDRVGLSIVDRLLNVELARARMAALEEVISRGESRLQTRLTEIDTQREAGRLSARQASRESAAAYRSQISVVETELGRLREMMAARPGDTVLSDLVSTQSVHLQELQLALQRVVDAWMQYREAAEEAIGTAINDALDASLDQIRDVDTAVQWLADSLMGLVRSVATAMNELASKRLAAEITDFMFRRGRDRAASEGGQAVASGAGQLAAAGGAVVSAGRSISAGAESLATSAGLIMVSAQALQAAAREYNRANGTHAVTSVLALLGPSGESGVKGVSGVKNFARGGYVSGPGTSTSDSIPARLSDGEYVLSASAVDVLGRETVDLINRGMAPIHLRRAGPRPTPKRTEPSAQASTFRGEISLSEGLVMREMESPAGQRAVVRVLHKNRNAVRGIL